MNTPPGTRPTREEDEIPAMHSDDVPAAMVAGWAYLDVRTEEEFNLGHVPGAYNVPFQLGTLAGLIRNPDFTAHVEAALQRDQGVILGCHSGNRSRHAARTLRDAGFSRVSSHVEGWDGSRDAFGRKTPGWAHSAHPRETHARAGRSYAEIRERRGPGD